MYPGLYQTHNNPFTLSTGDVVGCLVDYHSKHKSLICVLKNERIIYRRWVSIKTESLFPIINVWWGPVELHVIWLSENAPSISMVSYWETRNVSSHIKMMHMSDPTLYSFMSPEQETQ